MVNHIYEMMYKIVSEASISYVKWDMDRCMSEVYSTIKSVKEHGKVMHEYILGVYSLYERLIQQFSKILFE